jgi:predicted RNA-binding Zn ribbon-like protein
MESTTTDQPAPGDLAVVERFVNTADLETGADALGDPGQLGAWMREAGLAASDDVFDEAGRERVLAVREALRSLLLANHGEPADPEAIAVLDRAARDARVIVAFDAAGNARLAPAGRGVDGVVAGLLGIVARAQAEGTWSRLKACPADACGWAFYDRSRNRSRTWCTMSVCGNRAKARSYRARQR